MPCATQTADPRRWAAWLCAQLATAEDAGYFGPNSALWQLNREAILALGLGRALLMQLAQLGSMVGWPGERVPRDRHSLGSDLETVLSDGTIAVGRVARELAGALVRPRFLPGTHPFFRVYAWLTVGTAELLLPEVLREQYDHVLPRRHRGLYRLAGRAGRALVRRLSVSARTDPLAAYAIRRCTI